MAVPSRLIGVVLLDRTFRLVFAIAGSRSQPISSGRTIWRGEVQHVSTAEGAYGEPGGGGALDPTPFAPRFRRQVAGTIAGKLVALGAATAQAVVTARFLGPEGRGVLTIVLLIGSTAALLLGSGINVSTVFHVASRRLRVMEALQLSVAFVMAVTVFAAMVAAPLLAGGVLEALFPGIPRPLIVLGIGSVPVLMIGAQLRAVLQGQQRIREVNITTAGEPVLALALTVVVISVFAARPSTVAVAVLSAAVLSVLLAAWFLHMPLSAYRPRVHRSRLKAVVSYGRRAHLANTLQFLNYRLDVLIVNAFLGPVGVGIYTVATRMAELVWQVPDSIAFVLLPRSAASRGATASLPRRAYGVTSFASLAAAIALAALGNAVIPFLFGDEFASAYRPLLLLLPGTMLLAQAKVLASVIAGRGFPHLNAYIAAAGVVVTVVLDVLLIPQWGMSGAAAATTSSYATISVLTHVVYRRIRRA